MGALGCPKEVLMISRHVFKEISLPRLNNLEPNIESTCLKLMEEAGELAQVVGKFRGLNGEKNIGLSEKEVVEMLSSELLDVAQVAVSMMFVLEEKFGVNIDEKVDEHIVKLIRKGYICTDETSQSSLELEE
jgi:NTP pyrophosphatase (non-canonical NTP hydrolase)